MHAMLRGFPWFVLYRKAAPDSLRMKCSNKSAQQDARNTCHILAVACFATVVLASKEKVFGKKVKYKRLYRTTNLSRYIKLKEMKDIMKRTWNGIGFILSIPGTEI